MFNFLKNFLGCYFKQFFFFYNYICKLVFFFKKENYINLIAMLYIIFFFLFPCIYLLYKYYIYYNDISTSLNALYSSLDFLELKKLSYTKELEMSILEYTSTPDMYPYVNLFILCGVLIFVESTYIVVHGYFPPEKSVGFFYLLYKTIDAVYADYIAGGLFSIYTREHARVENFDKLCDKILTLGDDLSSVDYKIIELKNKIDSLLLSIDTDLFGVFADGVGFLC